MISRLLRKPDQNSSGDADPNAADQNPADPVTRLEMKIAASQHALMDAISGLEKLVTRLSGEQNRANALNEDALHEAEEAVDVARAQGLDWVHVDFEPHLTTFYQQCGFRPTAPGLIPLLPDATE